MESIIRLGIGIGVEPAMEPSAKQAASLLNDKVFLHDLRRQMLKFATLQLPDGQMAEDAVQEAFIGALKNASAFGGRAAFKTWVFAILKNKIADLLRQRRRLAETSPLSHDEEKDVDIYEQLFDGKSLWQSDERPAAWGDPENSLRDREFWQVFEACLEHLPAQQGRVFMMREIIELDSQEICAALGITVSNLNVMLHRARLRLRECLEDGWFLEGERK